MAELKTQKNNASVAAFLGGIEDAARRKDCRQLVAMMTKATRKKPAMWGPSIIGFGDREYTGASGKPTKWFEVGFSPRKAALSLYLMGGKDKTLLAKLVKARSGGTSMAGGCVYIKRLDEVDKATLQRLIDTSVKNLRARAK